jgi:hypothetical protein
MKRQHLYLIWAFTLSCLPLASQTATLPLYRLVDPANDHFYTTSCAEKNKAVSQNGYSFEIVQAYIFPAAGAQIVPFYRLIKGPQHFYTADPNEEQRIAASGQWRLEGAIGYIATTQLSGLTPLYRSWHSGDAHLYTTDPNEWNYANQNGWVSEGIAGYVLGKSDNPCIGPVKPPIASTPQGGSSPGEHSDTSCIGVVEMCSNYHFDGHGNKIKDGLPYPCGACLGFSL